MPHISRPEPSVRYAGKRSCAGIQESEKERQAVYVWVGRGGRTGCVFTLVHHPVSQTKKLKAGFSRHSRIWDGDGVEKYQSC